MLVKIHLQRLTFALMAVISCGGIWYALHDSTAQTQQLPEIYFYDKSDRKITMDSFKGKVVLVNLWASWCPPCVTELPSLARLQEKLAADRFVVVAISMDTLSTQDIRKFLNKKGAKNLEVYRDQDRQIPLKWKYAGLPTSFLIDRQGALVKRYDGDYAWDEEPLLTEIIGVLKGAHTLIKP